MKLNEWYWDEIAFLLLFVVALILGAIKVVVDSRTAEALTRIANIAGQSREDYCAGHLYK